MTTPLKPLLVSILRTVTSWAWGILIGWIIVAAPILQPFEESLLGLNELALPTVVALISGAWYAGWRYLEPKLPDWARRALLGSAKTPVYPAVNPLDRVPGPDHRAVS